MITPAISGVRHGVAHFFSYKSPSRLRPTAWLDGLRGVAALEVVLYHYAELWGGIDIGYGSRGPESRTILRLPVIRTLYDSGAAMVCLFFVISGFVLTQRVLKAFRRQDLGEAFGALSSSVFRRGLRLFPPAVASSFIALLLFRFFQIRPYGAHPDFVPYYDSFFQQLYHWTMETVRYVNPFETNLKDGFSLVNGKIVFLGHAYANVIWTIPVEYYGSMACYLELVGTAKLPPRTRNVLLAAISLWAALASRWILLCFNAGILMAEWLIHQSLYPTKTPQSKSTTMLWSFGLFAGIYLAGSPDHGSGPNRPFGFMTIWYLIPQSYTGLSFNYTTWSIAGILIACSCSQLAFARSSLETGLCQYLGKLSFSVYLLHIIVRDAIGYRLQAFLLQQANDNGTTTSTVPTEAAEGVTQESWVTRYFACIIWFSIMIPVVFIAAGLFERFIDAPLIQFSKWLEDRAIHSMKQSYDPIETNVELESQHTNGETASR